MKTTDTLSSKRDNNNKRIGQLIEELCLLYQENQELELQIQVLNKEDKESVNKEEALLVTSIHSGDCAVVVSPTKDRRGTTGHVESITKSKKMANFRSDTNQRFQVRIGNLFKLKSKVSSKKK